MTTMRELTEKVKLLEKRVQELEQRRPVVIYPHNTLPSTPPLPHSVPNPIPQVWPYYPVHPDAVPIGPTRREVLF